MSLYDDLSQPASLSSYPSYLGAADNHNIGNQGNSWFSEVGESISNTPKFFKVSALSGLNSFYNSGVRIGNFLGGDFEERKTSAYIASIDSDLGSYYRKNQEYADLAGFVLGSLIPGIAGVKILNAGQKALAASSSGIIGTNMGAALGLRATQIETYIGTAAAEITQGQAIFSSIGTSGVKALAAGVYQNVLEGLAFEVAVQATMNASPILETQDKSDILWNIAVGGAMGGVIGGAFESAKIYGKISKKVAEITQEIRDPGSRVLAQETGDIAQKIINDAYDKARGPVFDSGDPLYLQKVEALKQRQTRIDLDMRGNVGKLVIGGDTTVARQVADINYGSAADDIAERMLDTKEIARLGTATKIEERINKLAKAGQPIDPSLQVHYWKVGGEGMGAVLDTKPRVINLADTITGGAAQDTRKAVLDLVDKQKFSIKKPWDAAKMTLGSEKGHMTAEARQIWASTILKEIPDNTSIHMNDIPLLERAANDRQLFINLVDDTGQKLKEGFTSVDELKTYIQEVKKEVQDKLQDSVLNKGGVNELLGESAEEAQKWTNEKIAKITNTKLSVVEGSGVGAPELDYYGWQAAQVEREAFLQSKGLKKLATEENDPRFMPTWIKVTKQVPDRKIDGHIVDAITFAKQQEKLAHQAVKNVVAKRLGKYEEQLQILNAQDLALTSPRGAGAGMFTYENSGYGSPGSKAAMNGSVVQRATEEMKQALAKNAEGELANLARKQDTIIEWGGINQKVSRSAKQFVQHVDDSGLIAKEALDDSGNILKEYAEMSLKDLEAEGLFISVRNPETLALVKTHMRETGKVTRSYNELAAAQGRALSRDPTVFRPIPPDITGKKFIAQVSDPKVTGQGHKSIIFADDAQKLEALVNKAKQARPDLEINYIKETEDFFKARGTYEYDRTFSENYIDSSLKNNGIYSDYFVKTDPKAVIDEFLAYHSRQIETNVREMVRAHSQPAYDWLEDQAKAYSRVETSRLGGSFEKLEQSGKNPYLSYIKTSLNISRMGEHPLWQSANKTLDEAVSKAVGKIGELWDNIKGAPTDADMTAINAALQKYGMNTGYYDAATNLLVNHSAPKGELSKFIRGANAVLARVTLGMDPLNALTSFVGSNILRGTELTQITDAIKAGDKDLAGKLAALGKLDVTGQGDLILAPGKLIRDSMANFISDYKGDKAKLQWFKDNGFYRDISDQLKAMLGDLTLTGKESAGELSSRISKAAAKSKVLAEAGEKWSGNKLSEEMNRFISADIMKRITDLAVDKGLMSPREALSYINTFVNRVEGSAIASQRPFVFQGPIGQAVGLFQSYQFNLMQQMFRYVAEGSNKDAAMLLGLQGTFFGIQGLPAFQAINQHIIGTASGNQKHVDLYDATYGIAGKNLGDLLMYGIPSNILQTNMYSRGDINPRHVTILPTALSDVPFISAFTKFAGSLKETTSKIIQGGAVWESLLQGIEHNGISRPLAGLAQVLQTTVVGSPMSTTSKGEILFSNDLLSLATLSRLAGGRPLDEAIINDGIFRIHSYSQYDNLKKQALAETIKSAVIGNRDLSSEEWTNFAGKYAELGGKQVQFNKFMMNQIKSANTSQAEQIVSQLQNPYSQKVQILMGGGSFADTE